MKRKFFLVLFSLLVLFSSICSVNAFDETTREDFAINSRYTGVYSYFAAISAGSPGSATCSASAHLKSGYRLSGTMYLYKEGYPVSIASWSVSGSSHVSISRNHSVVSGNTYYVRFEGDIYDSNDNCVDSISCDSQHQSF